MLLAGKDVKIKLAVLYLIAQISNPEYIPLIEQYLNDENPKVRAFTQQALNELLRI
jgi:AAA family ATP:ADP antiporter